MSRKYDIILFGATGFTGALTCEYLLQNAERSVKWALAGRNLAKLEAVRERLTSIDESAKNLDLVIADSSRPDTLEEAVGSTRVVISTVGPFTKYGTPLVEACVKHKTHYVDITGEFGWIKSIIDKFDKQAKENHVMIVPACGFDSVPSDMGTFMVCDYLRKERNLDTLEVKASLVKVSGGASGGTLHSCIEAVTDPSLPVSASMDPYFLSPIRGIDKAYFPIMKRDRDFGKNWQAYFFMAVTNEKVVRRSWGLWTNRGYGYGRLFRYREHITLPFLPALIVSALVLFAPLATLLLRIDFFKRVALKCLPSSGTGPSREQLESGHLEMHFIATAETEPYDEPVRVRGIVKGFKDPGYGDTCRMVAESALSIVKSYDQLPGKEGGVLTSASAFGNTLLERLRANNGMVFEVQEMHK